jgi:hypothetical protein
MMPAGVRVHGLHLHKASWDWKAGMMTRPLPGEVLELLV